MPWPQTTVRAHFQVPELLPGVQPRALRVNSPHGLAARSGRRRQQPRHQNHRGPARAQQPRRPRRPRPALAPRAPLTPSTTAPFDSIPPRKRKTCLRRGRDSIRPRPRPLATALRSRHSPPRPFLVARETPCRPGWVTRHVSPGCRSSLSRWCPLSLCVPCCPAPAGPTFTPVRYLSVRPGNSQVRPPPPSPGSSLLDCGPALSTKRVLGASLSSSAAALVYSFGV